MSGPAEGFTMTRLNSARDNWWSVEHDDCGAHYEAREDMAEEWSYEHICTLYTTPEDEVVVLRMEVERLRGIIAEAKAATIERGANDAFNAVIKTHRILKRAEAAE